MRKNKLLIIIVLGVLLLLGFGFWFMRGKLDVLEKESEIKGKRDGYYEELANSFQNDGVIKKGIVKDEDRVSFLFTVEMVKGLSMESWGGLTGKIVVDGDELRREISVVVNNAQTFLGLFENSLEGNSVWNFQDNEKVAELINPGTQVYVQIIHDYKGDEKYIDYLYNHDLVLNKLLDDITNEKWKYQVPDDFELQLTDIGIVL